MMLWSKCKKEKCVIYCRHEVKFFSYNIYCGEVFVYKIIVGFSSQIRQEICPNAGYLRDKLGHTIVDFSL